MTSHDEETEHLEPTWRTIVSTNDPLIDVLVTLSELWIERCGVGIVKGKLDVCPRHFLTDEQDRRIERQRRDMLRAIPFAVPVRRPGNPKGCDGMFVTFERTAPGMWKGHCA